MAFWLPTMPGAIGREGETMSAEMAESVRPVMTADELRSHHVSAHGRDYSRSDDGYDDMENSEKKGWTTLSGWGRDGWDLGEWPFVVISTRTRDDKHQLQSVCEGDHDVYSFDSRADLEAAIDYLFVWYAAGKEYMRDEFGRTDGDDFRGALDRGEIRVDPKFRGPFSWARCDAEKVE